MIKLSILQYQNRIYQKTLQIMETVQGKLSIISSMNWYLMILTYALLTITTHKLRLTSIAFRYLYIIPNDFLIILTKKRSKIRQWNTMLCCDLVKTFQSNPIGAEMTCIKLLTHQKCIPTNIIDTNSKFTYEDQCSQGVDQYHIINQLLKSWHAH